jgi:undecaprenyl-diphosphatase
MIQAIVLGIVQGATEFIPISSSAHLVIVPWLFGWTDTSADEKLLFDLVLHWGTLLALLLVFWRDFWELLVGWLRSFTPSGRSNDYGRIAWFIIIATIPAVIAGVLFKDEIAQQMTPEGDGASAIARISAIQLMITGVILAASEWWAQRMTAARPLTQMNLLDSIVVGIAQALALLPGISRSGSTIAGGLARGIRRDEAARFSFLLGAPAIFGAGLLQLADVASTPGNQIANNIIPLAIGFVASAIVGALAIRFLLRYLRNRTLYVFSIYCFVFGAAIIGLTYIM